MASILEVDDCNSHTFIQVFTASLFLAFFSFLGIIFVLVSLVSPVYEYILDFLWFYIVKWSKLEIKNLSWQFIIFF